MKKAIRKGYLSVNGQVGKTGDWLQGGEVLVLRQANSNQAKKPLEFPLEVIFEDDCIAVVRKPGGIITSGNAYLSLANALPHNLAQSQEKDALPYPQPAHRLDYATSGLVLIGKTASCLTALNQQFENHQIQKTYHALSAGAMEQEGIVKTPIDGKSATSYYKVLDAVASERYDRLNLLELRPSSGRRHQLRKHLASIGHPILGDKDYATGQLKNFGKGLYLQASSLVFEHPVTKEKMQFELELPKKFKNIFKK